MEDPSRASGEPPVLPKARNWLYYDYYDFLVHPELQPDDPSGQKTYFRTIQKMRARLGGLSVLDELNSSRQLELGALVCDLVAKYQTYQSTQTAVKALRAFLKHIGFRNIKKILTAAELLRPLAAVDLPEESPFNPGLDLKGLVSNLAELSRLLPWRSEKEAKRFINRLREQSAHAPDPKPEATKQLIVFFGVHCGLAKNEAQVRTAKIGNALLGWDVSYRTRYEGDEQWKGSTAIRQRVARHRKR